MAAIANVKPFVRRAVLIIELDDQEARFRVTLRGKQDEILIHEVSSLSFWRVIWTITLRELFHG